MGFSAFDMQSDGYDRIKFKATTPENHPYGGYGFIGSLMHI